MNRPSHQSEPRHSPELPRRDRSTSPCSISPCRAHSFQVLFWLLTVYLLAIFFPGPGNALRSISLPGVLADAPNSLSHLVLGCLLFCAGLTVETARMPRVNLRQYPWALLLVWVVPILVVLSLCATLRLFEGSNGILLGLLIAAAMPVANSSVGWA
ncbi:MAG TPA: hypothetical protein VNQ76_21550, partial [Planctomicrobium sp.]|nr:hypothetical protein [Planctomicrobium sp.]